MCLVLEAEFAIGRALALTAVDFCAAAAATKPESGKLRRNAAAISFGVAT